MTTIKRPVLRYHGGKFLLAKWIISHFPAHRSYVEAFGGGGSVLMQKSRSAAEIYNDQWDTVVNVFRVLRDPQLADRLTQQLLLTPFSRTEFNVTGDVDNETVQDPVEKARRLILRSFAGFGSASTNAKRSTGFRANNRSNGTNCAKDWANYPSHIQSFVERLQGVVIENRDYREVIAQQDSTETLFYIDPPYVHITRNIKRGNASYAHEFTDQDHVDMAAVCQEVQGMVIISGYDCGLYRELFGKWYKVQRSAMADGASPRIECLWLNENAARRSNKTLL
jgi:DNA adenine methylase